MEQPIATTAMICTPADKTAHKLPDDLCTTVYPGATVLSETNNGLETAALSLQVKPDLSIAIIDKTKNNLQLMTVSPFDLDQPKKILKLTRPPELNIYGLGQQILGRGYQLAE